MDAPANVTLTITDDDEPPVERGVDISPTALTIGEGDATGGSYTLKLIAEPSEAVLVSVSAPSDVGLTVAPARLTFTAANWSTAQTVTVTAAEDDDADDRRVTLTHSASGAGYEDVAIDAVTVTVLDQIDPEQPSVSIADARGAEADGELVFELTLSRAAGKAVSVRYETRDGTARAGEDYEAGTGTATVAVGEHGARIVVPLRIDPFREADETFEVMLTSADGARLDDASATGTIEDAAEGVGAPEKLLARFGRIAGGHVMTAVGDQISMDRVGGTGVTLAGTGLTGDGASGTGLFGGGSFTADAATLDQFGQGGFGLAAAGGDSSLPVAGGNWLARPGESPWGGDGLAMGGSLGGAGGDRFGGAGAARMDLRELLASSAFLLNGGQDGGFSIWGRGNYTRFDNLGEGIQSDGDAVTATLGVDWSCATCRFGIALSRTLVEASYGESGREDGELESTITGLYPYLSLRISERFSVWGLAGQGEGELIARPAGDAPALKVDLTSRLAGLGARGELISADNGFSLALKSDAMYSQTSTGEAEGILEAEGEYRRVRLGLEGAWLRPIGEQASLRSSFEVAAREDAGDAENGLGVEVAAALEFIGPRTRAEPRCGRARAGLARIGGLRGVGRLGRLPLRSQARVRGRSAGLAEPFVGSGGWRRAAPGAVARPDVTGADRVPWLAKGHAERGVRVRIQGLRRPRRALGTGRDHWHGRGLPPRLQPADAPRDPLARVRPVGVRARTPPGLGVQPAMPRSDGRPVAAHHRQPRRAGGHGH